MYMCRYVYMYICIIVYVYMYIRKTKITENGNFRLFAANGKGKRTFVFLCLQTINGNRHSLCQPPCPSMLNQGLANYK